MDIAIRRRQMKTNRFEEIARKLKSLEKNRAEVDFLHCKMNIAIRRSILMSGDHLGGCAVDGGVLKIIAQKLIFYTVKMDITIRR